MTPDHAVTGPLIGVSVLTWWPGVANGCPAAASRTGVGGRRAEEEATRKLGGRTHGSGEGPGTVEKPGMEEEQKRRCPIVRLFISRQPSLSTPSPRHIYKRLVAGLICATIPPQRYITLLPPVPPSAPSPPPSPAMSDIKSSLHILSPGDKSYPHCHSVITGRKSWKTLKGKTEAVWPPYLEVALFEGEHPRPLVISTQISLLPSKGLSRYQPSNPRATKSLGRFPNRNRFISEYILKKTGKHRTPKQVGSRLQQLRDTHQGKQRMSHRPPPCSADFI